MAHGGHGRRTMEFSVKSKGVVPVLIAGVFGFIVGQAQHTDVLVQSKNGATAVSFPVDESPVLVKGGKDPSYVVLCSEGRQMSYAGMVPSSEGDPARNMLVFECAPSESTQVTAPLGNGKNFFST